MIYTFNGTTKIITLGAGTILDVKDMYSRWKDWILDGNSQFLIAFSVVGGDPIDVANGIYVTGYYFLENGWRVKPDETNYSLQVTNGVLLVQGGGSPFIQTTGSYNVLVQYSQPVRTETVQINTGGGGGGSFPFG